MVSGAPGISISAVLSSAPESALQEFVGPSTINVLKALNPELISRNNLIELAKGAAAPLEMLQREILRNQIIGFLPLEKARELANKLNIRPDKHGSTLYDRLIRRCSDKRSLPVLLSFFGVVVPDSAPGIEGPSRTEIIPSYGLFPYQKRVAELALAALREDPFKVVVHMPTGAGKTRTAMHIICDFLSKNPNRLIVWLAQTSELLEQAADEFEKAWKALGSFTSAVYCFWGTHDPGIVEVRTGLLVAGLGKLHALLTRDPNMIMRLGDRTVLTIIDEAHQAIAPTYKTLITYLKDKKPGNALLGLTATPGRTWADIAADSALSDFFGNRKVTLEIEGYTNSVHYLIEQGYLARPTFKTLNIEPGTHLSEKDLNDLSEQYEIPVSVLSHLAADDHRNIRIVTAVEDLCTRHQRVIVFASTVEHAYLVSSILNIRGTLSFVITGYTDRVSRESIITKFKSGDPRPIVICNFGVLTTGFDAPRTSAAVIARPTRSLVLYSQMVGRAIRGERAGGNKAAEIITVVDPELPGFGDIAEAFINWEDVWVNDNEQQLG